MVIIGLVFLLHFLKLSVGNGFDKDYLQLYYKVTPRQLISEILKFSRTVVFIEHLPWLLV